MERNFQPITGSLLRRQYVVILTSQKQSKEPENRDTKLWNSTNADRLFVLLFVLLTVHFTVMCSVTWPLSGSQAGIDLVVIQTLLPF